MAIVRLHELSTAGWWRGCYASAPNRELHVDTKRFCCLTFIHTRLVCKFIERKIDHTHMRGRRRYMIGWIRIFFRSRPNHSVEFVRQRKTGVLFKSITLRRETRQTEKKNSLINTNATHYCANQGALNSFLFDSFFAVNLNFRNDNQNIPTMRTKERRSSDSG